MVGESQKPGEGKHHLELLCSSAGADTNVPSELSTQTDMGSIGILNCRHFGFLRNVFWLFTLSHIIHRRKDVNGCKLLGLDSCLCTHSSMTRQDFYLCTHFMDHLFPPGDHTTHAFYSLPCFPVLRLSFVSLGSSMETWNPWQRKWSFCLRCSRSSL